MNFERTTRARSGHEIRERISVMSMKTWAGFMVVGIAAESAIQSGTCGKERTTSIMR